MMFTRGLVPFELTTALLLVAIVGAVGVARSRPLRRPAPGPTDPSRLFGGPLLARDRPAPRAKEPAG
jgi:hypothetical protein